MPKISVIVPVYNVAPYLKKCVDSIINQTLSDLEIILVDDGSTDESGTICDQYAQRDHRIKVIHKPNGGLSDARNAGLDVCIGDFIGFVDGDDYIDERMYDVLYDRAIKLRADVSGCMHTDVYNDRVITHYGKEFTSSDKNKTIEFIFKGTGGQISVCNKIFKKEIFANLRFEVGKYYEDAYIVTGWIEKSARFTCVNHGYYYYFHRNNSIISEKYSEKVWDVVDAYKYNFNIIKEKYPNVKSYAERRLWWSYRIVIERMFRSGFNSDKVIQVLRKNMMKILFNPAISGKAKLGYIVLCINKNLYMKMRFIKFPNKEY